MRTILLIALFAACTKKAEDKPAPATPSEAKPVENKAPAGGDPLVEHTGAFLIKLADAMDASGGDCDKLATGLEALAPDAKALRAELVAAHKKLDDLKDPPPGVVDRMGKLKDPEVLDKCEKTSPAVSKALDDTLLTIAPLSENSELVKAFGDAMGKAFAPTPK